jgi:hypothetical protein
MTQPHLTTSSGINSVVKPRNALESDRFSLQTVRLKSVYANGVIMAKFIHVQKAGYNKDKVIVDADYMTILNTDYIELVEPFELSRNDPGKYVRVLYKGEQLLLKGSIQSLMEKVH